MSLRTPQGIAWQPWGDSAAEWCERPLSYEWQSDEPQDSRPYLVGLPGQLASPIYKPETRAAQVRLMLANKQHRVLFSMHLDGRQRSFTALDITYINNFAVLIPVRILLRAFDYVHREAHDDQEPFFATFKNAFTSLLFAPSFYMFGLSRHEIAPPMPDHAQLVLDCFPDALRFFQYLYEVKFVKSRLAFMSENVRDGILAEMGVPSDEPDVHAVGMLWDHPPPCFTYADLLMAMKHESHQPVSMNATPPLPPLQAPFRERDPFSPRTRSRRWASLLSKQYVSS
ncbi:hypothetical protein JCM8547_005514 [Rhodosporidiobolus lusitaniae]